MSAPFSKSLQSARECQWGKMNRKKWVIHCSFNFSPLDNTADLRREETVLAVEFIGNLF